jgi:carboxylesterase type B
MEESAGAGSILHQITSYGGVKGPGQLPFQQAVLQSASIYNPTQPKFLEKQVFQSFLVAVNVSTLDKTLLLPPETLQLASKKIIYSALFELYIFRKQHPPFIEELSYQIQIQPWMAHTSRTSSEPRS